MEYIKIYFDWNILTNLISPENVTDENSKEELVLLKESLNDRDDNVIIPYSNAHLNDLLKSHQKGEKEKVLKSLQYLSELTWDFCIAQYWDDEKVLWQKRSPIEFFNSIISDDLDLPDNIEDAFSTLKEYGIDAIYNIYKLIPHNIDFEQVSEIYPIFSILFPKAKKDNSMYAMIQDVFGMQKLISTNPTVYNELRKVFKNGLNVDPNISNFNNAIQQLDAYFPKTMIKKSFTEMTEMLESKSKNSVYDKLIQKFIMLDYVGFNSDKLTEKNQYNNLFNDALHCFYAAHCDIYVTNDKKSYKKSKAVYESENINTTVVNFKEFINLLRKTEQ